MGAVAEGVIIGWGMDSESLFKVVSVSVRDLIIDDRTLFKGFF